MSTPRFAGDLRRNPLTGLLEWGAQNPLLGGWITWMPVPPGVADDVAHALQLGIQSWAQYEQTYGRGDTNPDQTSAGANPGRGRAFDALGGRLTRTGRGNTRRGFNLPTQGSRGPQVGAPRTVAPTHQPPASLGPVSPLASQWPAFEAPVFIPGQEARHDEVEIGDLSEAFDISTAQLALTVARMMAQDSFAVPKTGKVYECTSGVTVAPGFLSAYQRLRPKAAGDTSEADGSAYIPRCRVEGTKGQSVDLQICAKVNTSSDWDTGDNLTAVTANTYLKSKSYAIGDNGYVTIDIPERLRQFGAANGTDTQWCVALTNAAQKVYVEAHQSRERFLEVGNLLGE